MDPIPPSYGGWAAPALAIPLPLSSTLGPLTEVAAWNGPPALAAGLVGCIAAYAAGTFLRECLWHSVPQRVLEAAPDTHRPRVEKVLGDGERLAISADILAWASALGGFALLLALLERSGLSLPAAALAAMGFGAPLATGIGAALSPAFAASRGDLWLARWLPLTATLLRPLRPIAGLLVRLEHFVRSQFDLPRAEHARRIVEDLRDTIEDSEMKGELGDTSREIIENVIDLQDVDAAAVMTPRTEMRAVHKGASLREALLLAAEVGHGRLPVYEDSLDAICGTFSAREGLSAAAAGELDETPIASLIRPAVFVPETKRVTELLGELRRARNKLAIVLDEYGGTAGLVTMSDILAELVGDLPDEFDEAEPAGIRRLPEGGFEVDASERVSDVNEELELALPEDADYETIGGFVLAHLGRFPSEGESFGFEQLTVQVTRASDRRVLEVRLLPAAELSA